MSVWTTFSMQSDFGLESASLDQRRNSCLCDNTKVMGLWSNLKLGLSTLNGGPHRQDTQHPLNFTENGYRCESALDLDLFTYGSVVQPSCLDHER